MNTRRKVLLAVLALPALLLVVAAGGIAWLGWTGAGLSWTVARLESLDGVQLTIRGARGRLAGPLHVDRFELQTAKVTLGISGVDLDHRALALVSGRIAVTRLQAATVDVVLRRAAGASSAAGPPAFLPRWLAISFRRVHVGHVGIALAGGSQLVYDDVSLAGRITRSRILLRDASLDAGAWSAHGTATLLARAPLALKGEVAWRVPGTQPLSGTLKADGNLERLQVVAKLAAPTAAAAEISLLDLQDAPRWQARLTSTGFDLTPWVSHPPFGPLAGYLEGSGTLSTYSVRGHLEATGLVPGGIDLDAALSRDGPTLSLDSLALSARSRDLRLATTGWVRLQPDRALHLDANWTGLSWPLDGPATVTSPTGRLTADGWTTVDFLANAAVVLPGMPAARVDAAGRLGADGVTVTSSTIDSTAGRVTGSGFFGFTGNRPWQLTANVTGLDLQPFVHGVDSHLSFSVAGSGAGVGAQQAWATHVGSLTGRLRGYATSGSGTVLHHAGSYGFRDCRLAIGPARLRADGRVGEGATQLTARLNVPDLAGLLPAAGGRIEATASLHSTAAATKRDPGLRLDVAMRGRDLRYGAQHAAVLSADADVDLGDRDASWVRLRVAGLEVAGQQLESARLSLTGLARQHILDLRIGAGERAIDVTGTGAYQDGNYALVADRIVASGPRVPPYALAAPLHLTASATGVRLDRTCFVDGPQSVCLQGDWQRSTGWTAGLDVTDFPLQSLRVDLPHRPGYEGRVDVRLRAAGRPDQPWTARADGTLRDARFSYVSPSGRREDLDLGVTRLQLDSLPAQHHLTLSTRDSEALQQQVELTLQREPGVSLANSPLSGSLQLATSRLGLLPLLVPQVDRASGTLKATLDLSGTPASPVVAGTLVLQDGQLDLYPTNLRLRGLSAQVGLHDTRLDLTATGKAGDGTFRTEGSLGWTGRVPRGQLKLTGDRLLVANVPEARVEASPDLSFTIDGRDIAVGGSVTVPAARIEPRLIVGAVPISPDQVIVGDSDQAAEADGYRVSTNVRLVLGKHVSVAAFGLTGTLTGNILARTRPGEVATASGELEIHDGKYRAYSKELDVERGRLLFAGGPVTDPGVDLRAQKQVPGYTVGVTARGRLRKPELSLYSDPSLPQSQIASLLLVGRRLDNLDPADRSSLGGSSTELAAQGGSILAGQLGRYVGLDEVSFETNVSQESSLVLGKFLSPRLYVSYGISLTKAINTFKLRYTIGDRWVISAEAGEQASTDIEFTIDR